MRQINEVGIENFVKSTPPQGMDQLFKWSFAVKTRDKHTCQICGYKNLPNNPKYLVAHHMFYKSFYYSLAVNVSNGITLCNVCERQAHGEGLETPVYYSKKLYLTVPNLKLLVKPPKPTRLERIKKRFLQVFKIFFTHYLLSIRKMEELKSS